MQTQSAWETFDPGWGDGNSQVLRCLARVVLPLAQRVLTCCQWWAELHQQAGWQPTEVSLECAPGRSDMLLRCKAEGGAHGELRAPLMMVTGIRRLRSSCGAGSIPGFELRFARRRPRVQFLAATDGSSPADLTAVARFQLLHAFLAATASHMIPRVSPLEWPHEEGRRASLVHLAAVLRGVEVVEARDVEVRARFSGTICPVCLDAWDQMPPDRIVAVLFCGHAFCEQCLGPAVTQLQACPSCRAGFGPPSDR